MLSGCPSSEFFERLSEGDRDGAVEVAKWYREVFDGHYALEVQEHGVERFSRVNPEIISVGRELDIPVVATNDGHFTHKEEAAAHDVLLCIGTNATVDEEDRFRIDGEGYYLRSDEEMRALFPERPEVVTNTAAIAEACDLELSFDRALLPEPVTPDGVTNDAYLRQLCREGLEGRVGTLTPELQQRLDYELDVLRDTGFTDYFFVVKEISDFAHRERSRWGCGGRRRPRWRSTRWGSRTSTRWPHLVFERFLNVERRQMPDVDFDFADAGGTGDPVPYERFGEAGGADHHVRDAGPEGGHQGRGAGAGHSYADTDRVARYVRTPCTSRSRTRSRSRPS